MSLSVPENVKNAIEKAQAEFRRVLPEKAVRWTRREQFHLTLRFLGNVASARLNELIETTQAVCRSFAPLQVSAAGLGFFPDSRFPRVLWVGVKDQTAQLQPLWQAVQTATQPFTAEQPENSFTGHVTLARLNRLRRPEADSLGKVAQKLERTVFGQWTTTQLELMCSELSPNGARHTVLAEMPLNGT